MVDVDGTIKYRLKDEFGNVIHKAASEAVLKRVDAK